MTSSSLPSVLLSGCPALTLGLFRVFGVLVPARSRHAALDFRGSPKPPGTHCPETAVGRRSPRRGPTLGSSNGTSCVGFTGVHEAGPWLGAWVNVGHVGHGQGAQAG